MAEEKARAGKGLLNASAAPSIQGYTDGVFWKRNSQSGQKTHSGI